MPLQDNVKTDQQKSILSNVIKQINRLQDDVKHIINENKSLIEKLSALIKSLKKNKHNQSIPHDVANFIKLLTTQHEKQCD